MTVSPLEPSSHAEMPPARVIVVGNEKGGCGKSTLSVHLALALAHADFAVGTVDIDVRQGTMTRFMANRRAYQAQAGLALRHTEHREVPASQLSNQTAAEVDEGRRFAITLEQLAQQCRVIVIDTPGNDTHLNRLAHSYADVLVTPINDSFVDFDVLARVDPTRNGPPRPSHYSEMVWEQKKQRAAQDGGRIDWIVTRNRLSGLDARNKRRVLAEIESLAKRLGFRHVAGFGERVIFRELFPRGLTVLDLGGQVPDMKMTMSHVAARSELRDLLDAVLSDLGMDETVPIVAGTPPPVAARAGT